MKQGKWNDGEVDFLKANFYEMDLQLIAEKLNRPYEFVRWKANSLGLFLKKEVKEVTVAEKKQVNRNDLYRVFHENKSINALSKVYGIRIKLA